MFEFSKRVVLRLLRLPGEPVYPTDPADPHRMAHLFNAAPGYYLYLRLGWILGHVFGVLIATGATIGLGMSAASADGAVARFVLIFLSGLIPAIYMMILFLSYWLMRLNFEMRWYRVTDRSLRIREGVLLMREMTMTFDNIQNLAIHQGPIQRMFGIADLKVESAGGSGGAQAQQEGGGGGGMNLHEAVFRGVDNAEEIRDLMLARLKKIGDAGLGDPEDRHHARPGDIQDRAAGDSVQRDDGSARTAGVDLSAGAAVLRSIRNESGALRRAAAALSGDFGGETE